MGFVSSGAPLPKHTHGHGHTHTSCAVLGRVAQKRGLGSRLKAASWLPLPPSLHHHARCEARMRSSGPHGHVQLMAKTCHLCFLIISHTCPSPPWLLITTAVTTIYRVRTDSGPVLRTGVTPSGDQDYSCKYSLRMVSSSLWTGGN